MTFDAIKKVININAMFNVNFNIQYYFVIDISKTKLSECLFQLHKIKTETKTFSKLLLNERIIFFILY